MEAIAEAAVPRVLERLAALEVEAIERSPYLTVEEAAERLRCSRQRVYDLLSSGRLTRLKDGARVLVRRDEVDAYLAGGRSRLSGAPGRGTPRGRPDPCRP